MAKKTLSQLTALAQTNNITLRDQILFEQYESEAEMAGFKIVTLKYNLIEGDNFTSDDLIFASILNTGTGTISTSWGGIKEGDPVITSPSILGAPLDVFVIDVLTAGQSCILLTQTKQAI